MRMASHDLKNPLALLVGYLDFIAEDVNKNVMPDKTYIDSLYKAVGRMEGMIASLLDTDRADRDTPLQRTTIDPYKLLQGVLDDMMPSVIQHKHQLIQNIQPGLPAI